MNKLREELRSMLRSATPLVAIETADTIECQTTVIDFMMSIDENAIVIGWDWARGLYPLSKASREAIPTIVASYCSKLGITPVGNETDCKITELLCDLAHFMPQESVLIIQNLHFAFEEEAQSRPLCIQAVKNLRDPFKIGGKHLIGLVRPGTSMPPEIRDDIVLLEDELPTEEDLSKLVREQCQFAKDAPGFEDFPDLEEGEAERLGQKLLGMPHFTAEQQVSMSLSTTGLDPEKLDDRVRRTISNIPGLSVWKGRETFDKIGGLSNLKTFMELVLNGKKQPRIVCFIDEIEKGMAGAQGDNTGVSQDFHQVLLTHMQDTEAQGVLLLGHPGTGKTLIAKSIGSLGGIPVAKIDTGAMKHHHLGVSESNIRAAFKSINAMSGGRELFIATSNQIESLSPELRARFRLGTFFVDLPSKEEGEAIWTIQRQEFNDVDWELPFPDWTDWNGREINQCAYLADNLGISLVEASGYITPMIKSAPMAIKSLREKANGKYLSASYQGLYRMPIDTPMDEPQTQSRKRRRVD